MRSSSPHSPRSPLSTSYWASREKPRSAARCTSPLPGDSMQRPRPPREAALSFGRSSLGPEATGSKSSPSCKVKRLERASGGCRLRQAAGLLRCRSPGSSSGCAAPAPAGYFPLRLQSAALRSRSGARLHRMFLAASPVWQTTTSGAKDLFGLGVFFSFCFGFLKIFFLKISRNGSGSPRRAQRTADEARGSAMQWPCELPAHSHVLAVAAGGRVTGSGPGQDAAGRGGPARRSLAPRSLQAREGRAQLRCAGDPASGGTCKYRPVASL